MAKYVTSKFRVKSKETYQRNAIMLLGTPTFKAEEKIKG
jgi:hypothetical protein